MSQNTPNPLPRWRGFNLLEKFTADDGGSVLPASKSLSHGRRNPPFLETDFQWMAEWGFDFVRLPMSYHCWSSPERWFEMDEAVLADIDQAVEFGGKYGVHVSLNLHRAPGYCVNPPPEPKSLWTDPEALEACSHHWRAFAGRYRGIPSEKLSFDLLNEPPAFSESVTRADHERVIRTLVAVIRQEDPERLIIADGSNYGNEPIPELTDLGIAQSCRAYLPMGISHYQAPWVGGERFPDPHWPGGDHFGEPWDRERLAAHYADWAQLFQGGVGVHCGEGGCFNRTPHAVFLSWFADVLDILTDLGIGYSLWNFRGAFGVLDSGRTDVHYQDWRGHALDMQLLELLQAH